MASFVHTLLTAATMDVPLGYTTDAVKTNFDGMLYGFQADGVTPMSCAVKANVITFASFSQINRNVMNPGYSLVWALVGAIPTTSSGGGGGGAVTIADGADVAEGAKANAVDLAGTGTSSMISLTKGVVQNLVLLLAKFGSLGQKTMAGSAPVVLASDQSAIPVTMADGASVAMGAKADAADLAGTGTSTAISLFKGIVQDLVLMSAKLPASLGIKTAAASLSIAPASDAVFSTSTNVTQFGGTNVVTGSGGTAAGVPRVTIANDTYPSEASATAGSPLLMGGITRTAAVTSISANGIMVRQTMTKHGSAVVKPYSNPETDWQFASAVLTASGAAAIQGAQGANIRTYCTGIQYQNTSVTATEIQILDNATVIWRGYAPASMLMPAVVEFLNPLQGSANVAFNVNIVTTTVNVYFNAQGFKGN